MRPHKHRWSSVVLANRVLHLRCVCREVDDLAIGQHDWERPGRTRAHDRPARCRCHGYEVLELTHACVTHGRVPHGVKVRARGGLALRCRRCAIECDAREVAPEISRAASLRYWRERGPAMREARETRAMRTNAEQRRRVREAARAEDDRRIKGEVAARAAEARHARALGLDGEGGER